MTLPCQISLIESYPGEVMVISVNPTEIIVRGIQNASLQNVAEEVSRRLDAVDSLQR